jgi:hypothetical protein
MAQSGQDKKQLLIVNRNELRLEIALLTHLSPSQVLIRTNNHPPEETTHRGKRFVINQPIFLAKLSLGLMIPGPTMNVRKVTETTTGRVTTKTEVDITMTGDD